MRISDWSTDVCSSELLYQLLVKAFALGQRRLRRMQVGHVLDHAGELYRRAVAVARDLAALAQVADVPIRPDDPVVDRVRRIGMDRVRAGTADGVDVVGVEHGQDIVCFRTVEIGRASSGERVCTYV